VPKVSRDVGPKGDQIPGDKLGERHERRPNSCKRLNREEGPTMDDLTTLLTPTDCALLLIDQQAGLAFGVGSIDRQVLLGNTIALARTAKVFGLPVIVSTSATKVYSGPLMPAVHAVLPDVSVIDRRSMNVWEDATHPTGLCLC
jgi:hypothetical protein